jgi:RND family efflux transporter MFP subunit
MVSCGASTPKDSPDLAAKKAELAKLKSQRDQLSNQIQKLESDISAKDSSYAGKPKLVSILPLSSQNFVHYIDLQGKISTKDFYFVSPKGQPGQVKQVYIKEGDRVKKGQLLLKLDDAIITQQLKQLETQLAFNKDLYQRQQNLWNDKIGTEVQLITAKNAVENTQKQMDVMKEQWSNTNVYAEATGVVETMNVHAGEVFNGGPQGITIVNDTDLRAVVDVPENYLPRVKMGTPVVVEVPDIGKKFNTTISLVSQMVNSNSRAFTAEAKVPSESDLKPNLLALMKIQDYEANNVIVIPMTSLQTDEAGKYVFVAAQENGKPVAKKRNVTVGSVYGEKIEIKSGLQSGDQLITEGFQSLYDGQTITTS